MRDRVFEEQCNTCAMKNCKMACESCKAYQDDIPLHCACCGIPEPNEDSCKYYKRKED